MATLRLWFPLPIPTLLTQLISLLTLLIGLSVATERLVAIIQNLFPYLRTAGTTAGQEGRRKALVQVIAVVAGIITACLSQEILPDIPLLHIKGAETHWPVLGLLTLDALEVTLEAATLTPADN